MNDKQATALFKLYLLTKPECDNCKSGLEFRCCDRSFCSVVRRGLAKSGITFYKWNEDQEIPYMTSKGCEVSPEHRPGCAGFVCDDILNQRQLRRKYERLCNKAGIPPRKRGGV